MAVHAQGRRAASCCAPTSLASRRRKPSHPNASDVLYCNSLPQSLCLPRLCCPAPPQKLNHRIEVPRSVPSMVTDRLLGGWVGWWVGGWVARPPGRLTHSCQVSRARSGGSPRRPSKCPPSVNTSEHSGALVVMSTSDELFGGGAYHPPRAPHAKVSGRLKPRACTLPAAAAGAPAGAPAAAAAAASKAEASE